MDQTSTNSSTTILLVISITVLAIIGVGWFALDSQPPATPSAAARTSEPEAIAAASETEAPATDEEEVPADSAAAVPPADDQTPEVAEIDEPAADTPEAETRTPAIAADPQPEPSVESDLRKARMAAEAEMYIEPERQSALHFYGEVLEKSPEHAIANAELDAMLGELSIQATDLMAAQSYPQAFELARRVAKVRPEHALVNEVQQTLDQMSGDLVTQAMSAAEAGEREDAETLLAQAEALPGRHSRYFAAVRDSISDLHQANEDAEAERLETERATAARETRSWMEKVRSAIADGRLIGPADDCALGYVNERDPADEFSKQLRQELYSAVLTDASARIDNDNLESAEPLISAARAINGATEELDELEARLEGAYLDRESSRVVKLTDLVRRNTVPAEYPLRAAERGISGWVEVLFTVTQSGETADVKIANSEPEQVFDQPAVDAVEQWLFEPREFRGQTIAQRATARLVFRLE